jgi:hypothetical protein
MARAPKYQATVKVYNDRGTRMEAQGTRVFGARTIYLMMSADERKEHRDQMDALDAEEKGNG